MVVSLSGALWPFGDLETYPPKCKKAQGGVVCSYPVVAPTCLLGCDAGCNWGSWEGTSVPNWMNKMESGGDQVWRAGKQLSEKSKRMGEVLSRKAWKWGEICLVWLRWRQEGMNSPNEPAAPSAAHLAHPVQREQELLRPYSECGLQGVRLPRETPSRSVGRFFSVG